MPYRYGNWIFVHNRGWCWQPGQRDRWHTRPRLVNAPPSFRPPPPPRTIGWHRDGGPEPAPHSGGTGTWQRDGGPQVSPGTGGSGTVHRDGGPETAPQNTDQQGAGGGNRRVYNNDNVHGAPWASAPPEPATAKPGPGAVHGEHQPHPAEQQYTPPSTT